MAPEEPDVRVEVAELRQRINALEAAAAKGPEPHCRDRDPDPEPSRKTEE